MNITSTRGQTIFDLMIAVGLTAAAVIAILWSVGVEDKIRRLQWAVMVIPTNGPAVDDQALTRRVDRLEQQALAQRPDQMLRESQANQSLIGVLTNQLQAIRRLNDLDQRIIQLERRQFQFYPPPGLPGELVLPTNLWTYPRVDIYNTNVPLSGVTTNVASTNQIMIGTAITLTNVTFVGPTNCLHRWTPDIDPSSVAATMTDIPNTWISMFSEYRKCDVCGVIQARKVTLWR